MNQTGHKIGTIGLWHLGEVYSVCLAELGNNVIGYDGDESVVKKLQQGMLPIAEPTIDELLVKNAREGRISFTSNPEDFSDRDVIWVTYDTPVNDKDEPDTTIIFDSIKTFVPVLKDKVLIIITSQIPVGTINEIKSLVKEMRPELNFSIGYTPENLQLGRAAKSFLEAERIVVGTEIPEAKQMIESIFQNLNTEFIHMTPASAEVTKHALNAFLATSLSFIHDIADVCEATNANILEVSRALKSDVRIGQKAYLNAGIGFAGGTLGRDLSVLISKADELGLQLPVIEAALEKNRTRRITVLNRLTKLMGDLQDKTICILGLTYKPGTPTLRRSLALDIISDLKEVGATIRTHDPMADKEEVKEYGVDFFTDPIEAATGAEAVVIVTDCPEFLSIDTTQLLNVMKDPKIFFDTKNVFFEQEDTLIKLGFQYVGTGK